MPRYKAVQTRAQTPLLRFHWYSSSPCIITGTNYGGSRCRYSGADNIPNAAAHSIKVVDYGDDENSFEVVSFFNVYDSKNAELLVVSEYEESKLKPFHASNGNGVYTGLCE